MLRILGNRSSLSTHCLSRRDCLQVGGLSLFGGLTLPNLLRAETEQRRIGPGTAKSVILVNLLGGPPHMDMFDLKPAAPENVRGEFKPIDTAVPGVQICELFPRIAQIMDRVALVRTYSHQYNSHNPYNVYTGFDGGNDRENYFAKRTDHPGMGAVCQYMGLGPTDIPRYVVMPAYPGHSQALRRAGPYGGYLGAQYDPLFTVWNKQFGDKPGKFYDPVQALGEPVLPSLGQLPDVTADRLDRRRSLLEQIDARVSELEANRAIEGLGHFQQQVFTLLTSAKTRGAFDLTQEPDATRDRYGRNVWGSSLLIARRLVEAGSTFVSVNWEEADSGNHWDFHENNFGMLKGHAPQLDQMISSLILDLEQSGRLDSTLVVLMGEMGRSPRVNRKAGRDHWPQCGFVFMAGGGVRPGTVLGKTDSQAGYPIDRPVTAGDFVATVYHLLGINPAMTVSDLTGRPIGISHGGDPMWEILG